MQMHVFLIPIVIGLGVGILTRVLLVQTTYRQFPSSPHGIIIHVFLGIVASLLGALVVPAVIKPDFTAGVFVSIGAAQFHTMRNLERQAWMDLDKGEVIPRGAAYVEGMATAFEARIFLVLGVAGVTCLLAFLFHWIIGLVVGLILAFVIRLWKQGRTLADLADVDLGDVTIEGDRLLVRGIEIATAQGKQAVRPETVLAMVVRPKDFSAILTLSHHGQQQALLHNLAVAVGAQPNPAISPDVVYCPDQRHLILVMVPIVQEPKLAVRSLLGAPILEGVYRRHVHQT